jgi:superfamily II DNA or RNA helicase
MFNGPKPRSFFELCAQFREGELSRDQVVQYLRSRAEKINQPLFVLETRPIEPLSPEEPVINFEFDEQPEQFDEPIEERPPSPELFTNESTPDLDDIPEEPQLPKLDLTTLAHLNNHFPALEDGRFCASEFQLAILEHMQQMRNYVQHNIGLVVIATGLGKTVLVIKDIEREIQKIKITTPTKNRLLFYQDGPRARKKLKLEKQQEPLPFRFLFLVHSIAIRDEAMRKFKQHFSTSVFGFQTRSFLSVEDAGKITEQEHENAHFTFCLFQSFEGLPKRIVQRYTHCVIDEVHHVVAPTYKIVYDTLLSSKALTYMLGMTATLMHHDDITGEKLKSMFKEVVYIDLPWTVAKSLGCFPSVEYLECLNTLSDNKDIPTYTYLKNDFLAHNNNNVNYFLTSLDRSLKQLGMASVEQVKKKLTPEYIVDMLILYCQNRKLAGLPEKKKILIFALDIKSADAIADLINKQEKVPMKAASVHYKNKTSESKALSKFKSGNLQVLVNVAMINEGVDMPNIDCVVLSRLTESEIVFIQQMGRGLRKDSANDEKQVCIIDLALNLRRRWKRLNDELDKRALIELIKSFWEIDNFVSLDSIKS